MALYDVVQNAQRVYLGQAAETTFRTKNASWATHVFNPMAEMTQPDPGIEVQTDRDMHTGKEGATKQYQIRRGDPFAIALPWSPEAFHFACGFVFGAATVAGVGPYTHAYTLLAPGVRLPGFTGQFHAAGSAYDDALDWLMTGNTVDSVTFSGGRKDFCRIAINCRASGAYEAGASMTESSLIAPSTLIPGGKVRLYQANCTEGVSGWGGAWSQPSGAGGYGNSLANNLSEHLDSWEITIPTGAGGHEAAGVGVQIGVVGAQPTVARDAPRVPTLRLTTDLYTAGGVHPANIVKAWDRALFNASEADQYESAFVLEWTSDVTTSSAPLSGGIVIPIALLSAKPDKGSGRGAAKRTLTFEAKSSRSGTDYGLVRAYGVLGTNTLWGKAA